MTKTLSQHATTSNSTRRVTTVALLLCSLMLGATVVVSRGTPAAASPVGTVTHYGTDISAPDGIASGPDGNLWFTNRDNNSIGRITPAGVVSIFNGTGSGISSPRGITAGPDGNMWFANRANNSIGRITMAGVVSNFTGTGIYIPTGITTGPDGNLWFTGLDSIGRITPLGVVSNFTGTGIIAPTGITAGPDGNLWFTNRANASVGRITPTGVVSIFTAPGIAQPEGITAGPDGNLWFTNNTTNSIGRITPTGVVSIFTGPSVAYPVGIAAGPDGNLWFTNLQTDSIGRITPAGVLSNFTGAGIKYPRGIAMGPDGNLWLTNNSNNSIGRITPAGAVSNFTGSRVNRPNGITMGADGNLWFTNSGNNSIGRITPAGVASNFVGVGISGPQSIAAGPDGNLWFTNRENNSIGRITLAGVVANFTDIRISRPQSIAAGPDGNFWFTNNSSSSIGRITPAGVVSIFTGPEVNFPYGIVAGPDGNLWFTNWGDNSIGRVTPAGVLSRFTGMGINNPAGIAAGADGNLWFANAVYGAGSIGRISPTGVVSNFTDAGIKGPQAIAAGPDGNLWFANSTDSTIGRLTPSGVFSTFVTGVGGPLGISSGLDGGVWFTNFFDNSIGRITAADVPDAPTGVVGAAGNASATVGWVAPVSDGGSPITGYRVTASPGGASCSWSGGPLSCTVFGLTNGVAYSFTVFAANGVGIGPSSTASATVTPERGTFFHPLVPTRVLDSRGVTGGWNANPLVAGTSRSLVVAGGATSVPANAAAVVLNVTVTGSTADSFLSVFPTGRAAPGVSNLNFAAGETIANLATVRVGAGGQVDFTNAAGATDVVADIAGYFDAVPAGRYNAVGPQRILDSRDATGGWNGPLTAGTAKELQVTAPGGVPATADAVILNVTVTGGSANSFVSAYPAGAAIPAASNVNFGAGQTIANLVTVKLGAGGKVAFYNNTGAVNVIADVAGYFDATTGDVFHPLNPTRILDSRGTLGGWNTTPLTAANPRILPVTGAGGVPPEATAIIANATVARGTSNSFLTTYPAGGPVPNVSNLNFAAGQTIPNLVAVKLDNTGQIAFNNNTGSTDVIFDIAGYFAPT